MNRRCAIALSIALIAAPTPCLGAAADCKLTRVAEWPVRLERNSLIVDGSINGQKIGILIDTGAALTIVFRSAADELGLKRTINRRYRLFGVGGETNVEQTTIDEFKIGNSVRKDLRILVAGERAPGSSIAVLLGEDFLQAYDVEFDLAHGMLRLFEPKGCDGVAIAYWAREGAGEVGIDPIEGGQPKIVITVKINGRPVKAQLDSGAAISMLDKVQAERLGVTPETPGVVVAAGPRGLGKKNASAWIGPFESFSIGDETIRNTELRFSDWQEDAKSSYTGSRLASPLVGIQPMLLGADFLRAHRVLVSHSQQKIYFTYAGGPIFQLVRPPPGGGDRAAGANAGATQSSSPSQGAGPRSADADGGPAGDTRTP